MPWLPRDRSQGFTGTIARAISRGYYLAPLPRPAPMPEFKNRRALAAYHAMHNNSDPARLTYTHDCNDGVIEAIDNLSKSRCFHQPRHDVESVYWIIVTHILRTAPLLPISEDNPMLEQLSDENQSASDQEGEKEEINLGIVDETKEDPAPDSPAHFERFKVFSALLETHQIPEKATTSASDSRDRFLSELTTAKKWADVLHPGLESIAPMMARLTEFIAPEYEYLHAACGESTTDPLPLDHMHEGVQRILLDQIFDMADAEAAGDVNAPIRTHTLMQRGDANVDDARNLELYCQMTHANERQACDKRMPYAIRWKAEYFEALKKKLEVATSDGDEKE